MNILGSIGKTPLVQLRRMVPENAGRIQAGNGKPYQQHEGPDGPGGGVVRLMVDAGVRYLSAGLF